MFRKLLIAAVGALGLAAAGGCDREEGRGPGGTTPDRRDRPAYPPPTTPPPAPPRDTQPPPPPSTPPPSDQPETPK
jgi:hypothetical protein